MVSIDEVVGALWRFNVEPLDKWVDQNKKYEPLIAD